MHEPEIFEKNNKGTLEGTAKALDQMGHLIKWKPDHSDTILDIGCGPGNVLMNVVLPRFKGKYTTCYATDISDRMIDFAAKKYDREDVKFLKMDIMEVDEFLKDYGTVDHVVSSFVVHWLPDQDTGLKNIFKVLRPGGDFFSVHARDTPVFEIYKFMDANPKWNRYLDNLAQFIPSSHTSKEPTKDLVAHLGQIGFTEILVDVIENSMTVPNKDVLKTLFSSGLAQIHLIPEAERSSYLDDAVEFAINGGGFKVLETGEVNFAFNLFVVYGRKPE